MEPKTLAAKVLDNLIIVTILLTGLVILTSPMAIKDLVKYGGSNSWPKVEAEVLLSDESCGVGIVGGGLGYECERDFEYAYVVNGLEFEASEVEAFSIFNIVYEAPLIEKGGRVMVSVHPENHSRAIVYPGVWKTVIGIFIFPTILFVWFFSLSRGQHEDK